MQSERLKLDFVGENVYGILHCEQVLSIIANVMYAFGRACSNEMKVSIPSFWTCAMRLDVDQEIQSTTSL